MKCKKCNKNYNEITWHTIYANGERISIGGHADKNKLELAKAMKHTNYFNGYYNNQEITHESINHCFQCGYANNKTTITV